jgi:23S rRNA (guanosine2251-2'-O)-methyltransferase
VRLQVRLCTNKVCGLRFPVLEDQVSDPRCPRCGCPTLPGSGPYEEHKPHRMVYRSGLPRMEVLLDNMRSIYNVGSIFRTSDGAGISHLHLCGITPTPDNPKLKKTALGADETVGWTHYLNGCIASRELKAQGMRLWALEGGDRSQSIHEASLEYDDRPVLLVVGSEVCGVDPGILDQCEKVLALPMQGIKTSLNAAVAFGIAVYMLRLTLGYVLSGKNPS